LLRENHKLRDENTNQNVPDVNSYHPFHKN